MTGLFDSKFMGLRVQVVSPSLMQHTETIETKHRAHPLVCWLARFLPIAPYVVTRQIAVKYHEPVLMNNTLYVTPEQYAELQRNSDGNQSTCL